ncbi:hypothetical protein AAVH_16608 [Aphelenchoides avenae]|nr:hypothetical protein AAVH_16608 [Aphelenchus avenae]
MSQVRSDDVSIDVYEDEWGESTFAQRYRSVQNSLTKMSRKKRVHSHLALILRAIGHLVSVPLVWLPLRIIDMTYGVLALVVYLAAVLLFIPVNVALLPLSFVTHAPLAVSYACFDGALRRTVEVTLSSYILILIHRVVRKLRVWHNDRATANRLFLDQATPIAHSQK